MKKSSEHFVEVTVGERKEMDLMLYEAYAKKGVNFSVDEFGWELPAPYVCCMAYYHRTNTYGFIAGSFWYEETNLAPVLAMSHELGHYIDVSTNFNLDSHEYHRTLGTLELELRAWLYAVEAMKAEGFNHWKEFYNYARHCLKSYFEVPFFPEDHKNGFVGKTPTFAEALNRLQEKIGETFEEINGEIDLGSPFENLLRKLEESGMFGSLIDEDEDLRNLLEEMDKVGAE